MGRGSTSAHATPRERLAWPRPDRSTPAAHRQDGFTLIEVLVVISIIGFMALAFANFASSQLTFHARTVQVGLLERDASDAYGFFRKRFSHGVQIGLPAGTLCAELEPPRWCPEDPLVQDLDVDPLSVAGDQVIVAQDSGPCFRFFWIAATEQVRAATAPNCEDLRPVRGPNEDLQDVGGTGGDGDGQWEPGEDLYDPVLDEPAGSFLVVDHVVSELKGMAALPWSYRDADNNLMDADDRANGSARPEDHGQFYGSAANTTTVDAVWLNLFIAPASDYAGAKPVWLDQRITVGSF